MVETTRIIFKTITDQNNNISSPVSIRNYYISLKIKLLLMYKIIKKSVKQPEFSVSMDSSRI